MAAKYPRNLNVCIDDQLYRKIKILAKLEDRSMSRQVGRMLEETLMALTPDLYSEMMIMLNHYEEEKK